MEITVPLAFGVLIESVVFYADQFGNKRNFDWRMIAALAISIVAAAVMQVDIFADYVSAIPYAGSVMTGIVFSRVANATNDAIQRVRGQ